MDRSVRYGPIMTHFDSAYNSAANHFHHPISSMPISSSASFSSHSTRSHPKFNLDLYDPNEYHSDSFDYPSPSSSVIIHHHHPIHSSSPSPAISKLRQINDELCYTLAQCDLNTQSQPAPSHYHTHHHPISRETSPSPPRREPSSSSTDSEPIPKKRNARLTYKVHIPRRSNPVPQVDQLLLSTSDVYSRDEPMTVDLYPTRDQGFVRQIRNRPDNQAPWLAATSPIRRNSFSEGSTYRTPRSPYYDDAPIQSNSRLASGKVRSRSSSVKSRTRPDSAPNRLRQSSAYFPSRAPVWRPNGSIKRPKFIGSHVPPTQRKQPREPTWNPGGTIVPAKPIRAFDPTGKSMPKRMHEPAWNPSSKKISTKPPKYFEPEVKPELIVPIKKQTNFRVHEKFTIPKADRYLKDRLKSATSKVNSIRTEPIPTVIRRKPPIVPPPKQKSPSPAAPKTTVKPTSSPPTAPVKKIVRTPSPARKVPPPVKKVVPAPSEKTDTGRSSLNAVPTKPMFESTPRNRSIAEDPDDMFDEETQVETAPSPRKERTPPKSPASIAPESDQEQSKATVKDGDNPTHRTPSPKPDEVSIIDDEDINQPEENATDDDVKDTSEVVTPKVDQRKEPSPIPRSSDQSQVEGEQTPRPVEDTRAVDDFFDT